MCLFYKKSNEMYDLLEERKSCPEIIPEIETTMNMCVICLEGCLDDFVTLNCKHIYHDDCIIKFFIYQHKSKRNSILRRWYYNCPLCRKNIRCNEIKNILFDFYSKLREDYIKHKGILDKKRNKSMIYTMKNSMLNFFIKMNEVKRKEFNEKSEEMMNEISILNYEISNKKEYIKSVYRIYAFFSGSNIHIHNL